MAEMDIEKTPTQNTSVNKPESGTYGEKAELANLRRSLPEMQPLAGNAPAPGGMAPGSPPVERSAPMGRPKTGPRMLPGPILNPTSQPDVPLDQPRVSPAPPIPQKQSAADQQRLAILDALSTHPEVSEETREWAQLVLEALIESRR